MDWNWFFSAVAQCTAAIVGLFGAFLITKIISRESEYASLQRELALALANIDKQLSSIYTLYFGWYNERTREQVRRSSRFEELVRKNDKNVNVEELIPQLGYSPYDNRDALKQEIEGFLGTYSEQQERLMGPVYPQRVELEKSLEKERERIDKEMIGTSSLISRNKELLGRIDAFPRSRNLITTVMCLVTVLFFVGVIVPLKLLPTEAEPSIGNLCEILTLLLPRLLSVRGLILSLISIVFLSIMIIFVVRNYSQRFNTEMIEEIGRYCKLREYSQYFDNYETNVVLDAPKTE